MNQRHLRLAAKLSAGALAALTTFGALAQQATESILYTYQGQALTDSSRDARAGSSSGQIYDPGIAFSFYLEAPLVAGESVSFKQADGWYSFTGVMGENGAFDTWSFEKWLSGDYAVHSHYSEGLGSDGTEFWTTARLRTWNSNQPGVWTSAVVTQLPPGEAYRVPRMIAWVNPVPEADASVMALLGLAAVGVLARRKAKAKAQTETA